ncbi:hypothetical protein CGC48_02750 [Capnocytophaga cynodegmi]|uniref:Uncharacterized protein n=1 Tax=Capnocytophaga cynodegmi TaxID=28189 RepID=A0A250E7G0_9FLAO|nr:hypothetical protein [Capnocytophaga cynodegmi]ATA67647.1 hypothetical protein CGC48_02750 [Capnocytophaga cynodegmi]
MKDIFCDKKVIKGIDSNNKEIILKEGKQQIIVGGIPDNAILIKLDIEERYYKQKSFYLKKGIKFIHKGCDYVLILENEAKIILFELKSNNTKGYVDQFIASEIFMKYCSELYFYISNRNIEYKFHRILFSYKYNNTKSNNIIELKVKDKNENEVIVNAVGFPSRIRLQKIIPFL